MKKFMSISLIIVTVLVTMVSFTACSKDNDEAGEGGSNPKGLTLLADDTMPYRNHFATEDGYYYFNSDMHLMYIDYKTAKEIYLCNDSSCQHNTDKCSANFQGEFGDDSLIFAWNNKLYCLNRNGDEDGSMGINFSTDGNQVEPAATEETLYAMNTDGSDREKIFAFPKNNTTEKFVMGDGDSLWFITKNLVNKTDDGVTFTSSTNRQLVKYSTSKNKIVDTISLDFGDDAKYTPVGCDGNQLILCKTVYPKGMSESEAMQLPDDQWVAASRNSKVHFAKFDLDKKTMEELFSFTNTGLRSTAVVSDGYLYLSDCASGEIMKIDIDSGKNQVLCKTDKSYIFMDAGDKLCCVEAGTEEDNDLYFVDKKTGKISHCTLKLKELGWQLEMYAATDDKLLVVNEYKGETSSDGSIEIETKQFALIAKEDMYKSHGKYVSIDMACGGQ